VSLSKDGESIEEIDRRVPPVVYFLGVYRREDFRVWVHASEKSTKKIVYNIKTWHGDAVSK
jgi:hypothetical protein